MITQLTLPASEPVSLTDMKSYLKVDYTDEDALINILIGAARRCAEHVLNKNGEDDLNELLGRSHLDVNSHIWESWDDIHHIDVPDLTFRERFEINKLLPLNVDEIDID